MPETRKPKERAEILDELLRHNRWTGKELLERLNEKLVEIDEEPITDRTFKRDLEYLESKGAPLIRPRKGNMTYSYGEKFSLKEIPLDGEELQALKQATSILKTVDNFQIMGELDLIIGKLENKIHTNVPDNQTIVQFENHTHASGSEKFHELFEAIQGQTSLEITYHSYKHENPRKYVVHPYLLKEYRNRWFLLCRSGNTKRILTLGLDRIKKIRVSKSEFIANDLFDPDTFFDKVIGVSMDYNDQPKEIILKVYPVSVRHIESKPIHKNQELLKKEPDGSLIIKLDLIINYELKATIKGLGEGVEVIEPAALREEIIRSGEIVSALYKKDDA